MAHIKVKKGLDIPIKGKPEGGIKPLTASGSSSPVIPKQVAFDFKPFDLIKFRLLVKVGDIVKIGQPLAEDKEASGRLFVSPAGGVVNTIQRGNKRALQAIVIDIAQQEESILFSPINVDKASREELIERLKVGGCFAGIRSRPFGLLANPDKTPRSIFVKAIESALFTPPAELQVMGHENEFQVGLNVLAKLTASDVHLVYRKETVCTAFSDARNVKKHTAEGPHPVGNYSVHIQQIAPILSADDNVWTLNVRDVIAIGFLMTKGQVYHERVIGIGGPGILSGQTGYFKVRDGFPISGLIAGRIKKGLVRLVSGDPLMGHKVEEQDFLGFYDDVFCAIPENTTREFLHFFRLGTDKYTFSHAYFTGHLDNTSREYDFTTNQHGEHRAFIDSSLYDKVQPLDIPTMLLVKAVMAEDFELAETLGILEVDSEDFALATFVCPSKMEMTEIMKLGIRQCAKERL